MTTTIHVAFVITTALFWPLSGLRSEIYHAQGEMAGELTAESVLLQSRLTAVEALTARRDVPGMRGVARFVVGASENLASPIVTAWMQATEENDFIVRHWLRGLKADTPYYYRLEFGIDEKHLQQGPLRLFRTLPDPSSEAAFSFLMFNCMCWSCFVDGQGGASAYASPPYSGPDKMLGYPTLDRMISFKDVYFAVGAGDNVYYDIPVATRARTLAEMRIKWQQQFSFPRLVSFLGSMGSYWMKDDHDFRFNDSDSVAARNGPDETGLVGGQDPSPELGIRTFKEQMPVVPREDFDRPTYRTVRASRYVQLWFIEGRDYRSPNQMKDGPEKTLWGKKQKEWLKQTLASSDATWKLIVTPTPMVGPDDAQKNDNHVSRGGFRYEGEEFFSWLAVNKIKNVALFCGDRHWLYHSIHPSGVSEFSCGSLAREGSRLGMKPGDPKSTDPEALVRQPFTSPKANGGFLHVSVDKRASLTVAFIDEEGNSLYTFNAVK